MLVHQRVQHDTLFILVSQPEGWTETALERRNVRATECPRLVDLAWLGTQWDQWAWNNKKQHKTIKTIKTPRMRGTSRMKWLLAWPGAQGQWVWLPTVEYSDWLRLTQTIASHCFTILAQKPPVLRLAVPRSSGARKPRDCPQGLPRQHRWLHGYTATRLHEALQSNSMAVLLCWGVEQWLWWLWWIQAWPKEADSTKSIQVHWTWHQDTSSTFKDIWFIW